MDYLRRTAALRRTQLRLRALAILQHPGVQPFLDEPHEAPVRDAVLDEPHQPAVIDRVERPLDRLPTTSTTIRIK
jgi:hypothetical protein